MTSASRAGARPALVLLERFSFAFLVAATLPATAVALTDVPVPVVTGLAHTISALGLAAFAACVVARRALVHP